ncbi:MAG: FAD-binding oxidoreductase [Ignavibacteriaceae bacterium]
MIIKTNQDEIQNFVIDASNFHGNCEAVYFPASSAEVSQILKEADAKKILVTVAGNGTGLTGARVPQGGIVISTEKMNKVLEINKNEKFAVVEPGVILSNLLEMISGEKLLYPPDPTEKNCFIGGTVATNASGEKTFKYGPTRDYVLELEIVLPTGELLNLKRGAQTAEGYLLNLQTIDNKEIKIEIPNYKMPATKNASGYFCKINMDAIDLFIGSEGTLGVITKIKLKLLSVPEKIISCVVFFNHEKNAFAFIQEARNISINTRLRTDERTIDALALEYFDGHALKFLSEEYQQIPQDAKAGVWFEQEVTHSNEEIFFEYWMDLIKEFHGDEESVWFAVTDADKTKLQEFRHSISWKVNEYITKNNFRKLGTDVAVPDTNFEELYFFSKHEVERAGLDYVIYGHFGNSHMHLNMLPKNNSEFETGKTIYKNICLKAIELKGTISAEHGIGKIKKELLLAMYGKENIKKMIALKKTVDPNLILGKGNIFDAA